MKTVTGRVISAEPISLSTAAKLLSVFASSDNGVSQDVSAYLRRASAAFTELKGVHREIKGGKIRSRKIETVSEDESIYGREQDEIKDDKEEKKKKKKSKKKKEEDVVDEKVKEKEKLEDEQRNEERKEKKKKKNRNSDGEIGSEEKKCKKRRKSKEIDG